MWLAHEVKLLGDWHLRANDGVTWRANSVLPVGDPGLDFEEAIQRCIEFYQTRNIRPSFQLTSMRVSSGIEESLDRLDWLKGIIVETHTKEISNYQRFTSTIVDLLEHPVDEWFDCFLMGSHRSMENIHARRELMLRSKVPKAFAQVEFEGKVVCVGLGMVHNDWLGIFRIGTLPEYRSQGFATSLNDALMEWGSGMGATHAFLQVEEDNENAKRIYASLGFDYLYTYWYRYVEKNEV